MIAKRALVMAAAPLMLLAVVLAMLGTVTGLGWLLTGKPGVFMDWCDDRFERFLAWAGEPQR